jgi:hypothetical protein
MFHFFNGNDHFGIHSIFNDPLSPNHNQTDPPYIPEEIEKPVQTCKKKRKSIARRKGARKNEENEKTKKTQEEKAINSVGIDFIENLNNELEAWKTATETLAAEKVAADEAERSKQLEAEKLAADEAERIKQLEAEKLAADEVERAKQLEAEKLAAGKAERIKQLEAEKTSCR